MEKKEQEVFKIKCKVADFTPKTQGSGNNTVSYLMAKPLALLRDDSKLVLLATTKKVVDTRYEVVTGEHKGMVVVINPESYQHIYIIRFEDGDFEMIPDFAILGEIKNETI